MNFSKWGYPPLWEKSFFYRVLGRFSIVLEFLMLFAKSSGKLLPKKKNQKKAVPPLFENSNFSCTIS